MRSLVPGLVLLLGVAVMGAPALAGATASAFKKETKLGTNYWNAGSAIDGRLDTCWQVPGNSENRGEWIMLDIPKGEVDAIGIFPGWGASEEKYEDYARIKELGVEVLCCTDSPKMESLFSGTVQFADEARLQFSDMQDVPIGNDLFGGKIRLTIKDIYEGRDFPNVALSEVLIVMKEFDAPVAFDDVPPGADGHGSDLMQDENAATYWVAAADSTISFTSEGFGISSIGIQAGPAQYARAQKVRVTANDKVRETELANSADVQYAEVPPVVGYTGSAWGDIVIEILEVYPGTTQADVSIAEFTAKATNYSGI